MKVWHFRATLKLGLAFPSKRFEVEADSLPEAAYDAKKQVEAWANQPGSSTRDLVQFDLLYSKPI